ncbi:hypothetical protein BH23THE1_BH23THE1_24940 [soil metagenome]
MRAFNYLGITDELLDNSKRNKTPYSFKYQNHTAYRNFIFSLKSSATKYLYSFYLSKFLNYPPYNSKSLDEILENTNIKTVRKLLSDLLKD